MKNNILLVEDDEFNVELIAKLLRSQAEFSYELKIAQNGKQALEIMDLFVPDVIILDLKMPVMDGKTFLEELKKLNGRFRNTKVIVCSAYASIEEQHEILNLGAELFVQKINISKILIKTVEHNLRKEFNTNYLMAY